MNQAPPNDAAATLLSSPGPGPFVSDLHSVSTASQPFRGQGDGGSTGTCSAGTGQPSAYNTSVGSQSMTSMYTSDPLLGHSREWSHYAGMESAMQQAREQAKLALQNTVPPVVPSRRPVYVPKPLNNNSGGPSLPRSASEAVMVMGSLGGSSTLRSASSFIHHSPSSQQRSPVGAQYAHSSPILSQASMQASARGGLGGLAMSPVQPVSPLESGGPGVVLAQEAGRERHTAPGSGASVRSAVTPASTEDRHGDPTGFSNHSAAGSGAGQHSGGGDGGVMVRAVLFNSPAGPELAHVTSPVAATPPVSASRPSVSTGKPPVAILSSAAPRSTPPRSPQLAHVSPLPEGIRLAHVSPLPEGIRSEAAVAGQGGGAGAGGREVILSPAAARAVDGGAQDEAPAQQLGATRRPSRLSSQAVSATSAPAASQLQPATANSHSFQQGRSPTAAPHPQFQHSLSADGAGSSGGKPVGVSPGGPAHSSPMDNTGSAGPVVVGGGIGSQGVSGLGGPGGPGGTLAPAWLGRARELTRAASFKGGPESNVSPHGHVEQANPAFPGRVGGSGLTHTMSMGPSLGVLAAQSGVGGARLGLPGGTGGTGTGQTGNATSPPPFMRSVSSGAAAWGGQSSSPPSDARGGLPSGSGHSRMLPLRLPLSSTVGEQGLAGAGYSGVSTAQTNSSSFTAMATLPGYDSAAPTARVAGRESLGRGGGGGGGGGGIMSSAHLEGLDPQVAATLQMLDQARQALGKITGGDDSPVQPPSASSSVTGAGDEGGTKNNQLTTLAGAGRSHSQSGSNKAVGQNGSSKPSSSSSGSKAVGGISLTSLAGTALANGSMPSLLSLLKYMIVFHTKLVTDAREKKLGGMPAELAKPLAEGLVRAKGSLRAANAVVARNYTPGSGRTVEGHQLAAIHQAVRSAADDVIECEKAYNAAQEYNDKSQKLTKKGSTVRIVDGDLSPSGLPKATAPAPAPSGLPAQSKPDRPARSIPSPALDMKKGEVVQTSMGPVLMVRAPSGIIALPISGPDPTLPAPAQAPAGTALPRKSSMRKKATGRSGKVLWSIARALVLRHVADMRASVPIPAPPPAPAPAPASRKLPAAPVRKLSDRQVRRPVRDGKTLWSLARALVLRYVIEQRAREERKAAALARKQSMRRRGRDGKTLWKLAKALVMKYLLERTRRQKAAAIRKEALDRAKTAAAKAQPAAPRARDGKTLWSRARSLALPSASARKAPGAAVSMDQRSRGSYADRDRSPARDRSREGRDRDRDRDRSREGDLYDRDRSRERDELSRRYNERSPREAKDRDRGQRYRDEERVAPRRQGSERDTRVRVTNDDHLRRHYSERDVRDRSGERPRRESQTYGGLPARLERQDTNHTRTSARSGGASSDVPPFNRGQSFKVPTTTMKAHLDDDPRDRAMAGERERRRVEREHEKHRRRTQVIDEEGSQYGDEGSVTEFDSASQMGMRAAQQASAGGGGMGARVPSHSNMAGQQGMGGGLPVSRNASHQDLAGRAGGQQQMPTHGSRTDLAGYGDMGGGGGGYGVDMGLGMGEHAMGLELDQQQAMYAAQAQAQAMMQQQQQQQAMMQQQQQQHAMMQQQAMMQAQMQAQMAAQQQYGHGGGGGMQAPPGPSFSAGQEGMGMQGPSVGIPGSGNGMQQRSQSFVVPRRSSQTNAPSQAPAAQQPAGLGGMQKAQSFAVMAGGGGGGNAGIANAVKAAMAMKKASEAAKMAARAESAANAAVATAGASSFAQPGSNGGVGASAGGAPSAPQQRGGEMSTAPKAMVKVKTHAVVKAPIPQTEMRKHNTGFFVGAHDAGMAQASGKRTPPPRIRQPKYDIRDIADGM